jgi:predicted nucleic acid-binding protein
MIFVDTSAWFAAQVPSDPHHRAVQGALQGAVRLVTTDYRLDETLTLLKARGHVALACQFGAQLLEGRAARLEYLTAEDVQQAWMIFSTYRDKLWNFTDCSSLAVMKRIGIEAAITLDGHFSQMAGISVVAIE